MWVTTWQLWIRMCPIFNRVKCGNTRMKVSEESRHLSWIRCTSISLRRQSNAQWSRWRIASVRKRTINIERSGLESCADKTEETSEEKGQYYSARRYLTEKIFLGKERTANTTTTITNSHLHPAATIETTRYVGQSRRTRLQVWRRTSSVTRHSQSQQQQCK